MKNRYLLGIDIGGSGVKGGVVDLEIGELTTKRKRIPTPQPSTPENVASVVKQIVDHFADQVDPDLPVGITIPAIVLHGVTASAANIDQSWVNAPAAEIFSEALGRPVVLVNDADAAGLAEVRWGAAKGHPGMVIVTTLGTGIGSALVYRGVLVPNTELGHIEIDGHDAETRAAASVKKREELSYEEYIPRLALLRDPGVPVLPRPVRGGGRHLQGVRELPAVPQAASADHPGEAAQRRGHRGCRRLRGQLAQGHPGSRRGAVAAGYIRSGASMPSNPSPVPSTRRVAAHSASLDARTSPSARSTGHCS